MHHLILVLMVLLSACSKTAHADSDAASNTDHIQFKPFTGYITSASELTKQPPKNWRVKAVAEYLPTNTSQPSARETTTSYDNCPKRGRWDFNINVLPCKAVKTRVINVEIPPQQMQLNNDALNLSFKPYITHNKLTAEINTLQVDIQPCPSCTTEHLAFYVSCQQQDKLEQSVIQQGYVYYQTNKQNPPTCGLAENGKNNFLDKAAIVKVIKGKFTKEDRINSGDFLNRWPAFPTPSGQWVVNRSYGPSALYVCPLNSNVNRVDFTSTLSKADGWAFSTNVTGIVYKIANTNQLCAIWVDEASAENKTNFVRTFFQYYQGKLGAIRIDNALQGRYEWFFDNDQPLEYSHIIENNAIGGNVRAEYWQRDAARYWVKRMDYQPDIEEFKKMQRLAQRLEAKFGNLPPQQTTK